MLGSIISAGASLIGGFGKQRAQRRQIAAEQQARREDQANIDRRAAEERAHSIEDMKQSLPRLRESAELAGFNPLTALGSGASGGFNGAALGVGGYLPSSQGGTAPLSSLEILSGTIKGAADDWTSQNSVESKILDTRLELEKVRLEQLKQGGAAQVVAASQAAQRTGGGKLASLGVKPRLASKRKIPLGGDGGKYEDVRDVEVDKVGSVPGYQIVNSRATLGYDTRVWGSDLEGDPFSTIWAGAQIVPQVLGHMIFDEDLKYSPRSLGKRHADALSKKVREWRSTGAKPPKITTPKKDVGKQYRSGIPSYMKN